MIRLRLNVETLTQRGEIKQTHRSQKLVMTKNQTVLLLIKEMGNKNPRVLFQY